METLFRYVVWKGSLLIDEWFFFFLYIRDYEFGVILIIRELIERQFNFVHFFFIELYKFDVYSLNWTIDVILRFNIIVIHK